MGYLIRMAVRNLTRNTRRSFLSALSLVIALMMIVGIPIYVCATASVPLAAGFIALAAMIFGKG